MKITIREPLDGEEEQAIIISSDLSPELLSVLKVLKVVDDKLIGKIDNKIFRIDPSDVYYIESINNKVFLHGNSKYESQQKLYELEEQLQARKFLRVSKSFIINLREVKSLAPALQGRLEAGFANGESVIISRQYVHRFKDALGLGKDKS